MKTNYYLFSIFLIFLFACNDQKGSSGIVSTVSKSFDYAINNHKTTTSISIKEKGIKEIPIQIDERFTSLIQIILNGNEIKEVPSSLGRVPKLKMIHLDNNQINKLPNSIEELSNIETLQLNKNNLTELPNVALRFTEKARVSFRWNKLEKLPNLFCYSRFGYLHLTGNPLTELPENFGNIQGLKELNLANTNISKLPDSFYNLVSLRNLDVRGTKLTKKDIELINNKLPDCFVQF